MRAELSGLGLFKGKQKEALNQNIIILENKKNGLRMPQLADFGIPQSIPGKIGELQLPPQPVDSDEPIYPEKPVQAEKPVRDECSKKVDGFEKLCNVLENKSFNTKNIKEKYRQGEKRKRREKEILDKCNRLNIKYKDGIITYGVGPDRNPLEWRVLTKNGNELLLVTKQVINVVRYNEKYDSVTWANCTLRAYLNNEFIKNTFSSEEQAGIKQVKLGKKCNKKYGTSGGSDTTDKVFCLSMDEVDKYFRGDKDRVAIPTKYAKGKLSANNKERFMDKSSGGGRWWLRTSCCFVLNAAYVEGSGLVYGRGIDVNSDVVGVRPALWLNLES